MGSTAQRDLFDYSPTSGVANHFKTAGVLVEKKPNVLITFRHLLASQGTNAP